MCLYLKRLVLVSNSFLRCTESISLFYKRTRPVLGTTRMAELCGRALKGCPGSAILTRKERAPGVKSGNLSLRQIHRNWCVQLLMTLVPAALTKLSAVLLAHSLLAIAEDYKRAWAHFELDSAAPYEPDVLGRHVEQGLRALVQSTLNTTSVGFEGSVERFLEDPNHFMKGPWVSIDLPFKSAVTPNGDFQQPFPEIPLQFVPYQHQLSAFNRLAGGNPRSTLIATGTGSGKTESYLWPILDCGRTLERPTSRLS